MNKSFCMTSYNAEKRIRYSLLSIIPNIKPDDEFICVDNFSKDTTWEILKEVKDCYPDTSIRLYQRHCNRGGGRQYGCDFAVNNRLVFVDADTFYGEIFWKVITEWEKNKLSEYCFLSLNEAWYLTKNLIDRLGGFPDLNANDDVWLFYKTIPLDAYRWFPYSVGENWVVVDREQRFTNSIVRKGWRTFMSQKDKFRTDPMIHYLKYIKHYKDNIVKRKWSLYLFWIPLFTFLSCYKPFNNLPDEVSFNKDWIIDFGLVGEKKFDSMFWWKEGVDY